MTNLTEELTFSDTAKNINRINLKMVNVKDVVCNDSMEKMYECVVGTISFSVVKDQTYKFNLEKTDMKPDITLLNGESYKDFDLYVRFTNVTDLKKRIRGGRYEGQSTDCMYLVLKGHNATTPTWSDDVFKRFYFELSSSKDANVTVDIVALIPIEGFVRGQLQDLKLKGKIKRDLPQSTSKTGGTRRISRV